MKREVPVIDVGRWFDGDEIARDGIARQIDDACKEWGFLIICGHRMDPSLMQAVADVSRNFFDLPVEEKMKADAKIHGGRGYYGMKSKAFERSYGKADAPGDLRESFSYRADIDPLVGQPAGIMATAEKTGFWPARPRVMQQTWTDYLQACDRLAADLMQICARALVLPDTWFDDKIDRPMSSIVAQHYPALEAAPEPGQIRGSAHTDFGTLTLLMAEDKPGGLQVMGTDGNWHDLKPISGAYIVNLGDMMAQWTNDRWRSTLHRVVNPPLDSGKAARRLSIVYFHNANYDAVIECIPSCTDERNPPKYPPMISGEHLRNKVQQVRSVTRTA
jgi:isopenicillin N synthase-like dioxygenase